MDFYCSITIQTFFLLSVVDLVDFLFFLFVLQYVSKVIQVEEGMCGLYRGIQF